MTETKAREKWSPMVSVFLIQIVRKALREDRMEVMSHEGWSGDRNLRAIWTAGLPT